MARKPMDLPTGVEVRGGALRIRFSWRGVRCSETLTLPTTQTGIASASRLRDQVVSLNKLGLLDEAKYAELFPVSAKANDTIGDTFGEYAQIWLDSREISTGTRINYKSALNIWWMPYLATKPLKAITPSLMRLITSQIAWTSSSVKSACMSKLSTILSSAVHDGLLLKNPMDGLELPKKVKKKVDPLSQTEADQIIKYLYERPNQHTHIYGAFIEFAFYTGMRLGELFGLRWDEIDFKKKTAYVCRVIAFKEVAERTKTGPPRTVLLNERAIHALEFAKKHRELNPSDYCFPPSQGGEFIKSTTPIHKNWRHALDMLGLRYRKPYSTRHTYATMCLMSGMNPAFIAKQLGHSIDMLLSTYAQWISNQDDWSQMKLLKTAPKLPQKGEKKS